MADLSWGGEKGLRVHAVPDMYLQGNIKIDNENNLIYKLRLVCPSTNEENQNQVGARFDYRLAMRILIDDSTVVSIVDIQGLTGRIPYTSNYVSGTINIGKNNATVKIQLICGAMQQYEPDDGCTIVRMSGGSYYGYTSTSFNNLPWQSIYTCYVKNDDPYVWIYANINGVKKWHKAIPYIYTSNKWHRVKPLIYHNRRWKNINTD